MRGLTIGFGPWIIRCGSLRWWGWDWIKGEGVNAFGIGTPYYRVFKVGPLRVLIEQPGEKVGDTGELYDIQRDTFWRPDPLGVLRVDRFFTRLDNGTYEIDPPLDHQKHKSPAGSG